MEGNYPVILEGREQGMIEVRQEGLMTVFRARCADPGQLVRLSLYGEREGYLGVMAPGSEGLELERRLSRAALREFPRKPRYAAPAGAPLAAEPDPDVSDGGDTAREPEKETPDTKINITKTGETEDQEDPDGGRKGNEEDTGVTITEFEEEKISDINDKQNNKVDIIIESAEELASADPAETEEVGVVDITNDIVWYAGPGGCLYGAGAGGCWLAVPAAAEADPTGGRGLYREIQGRSYLLFRTGQRKAEN